MKKTEPRLRRASACMIVEGDRTYCVDPAEGMLGVIAKKWALLVIGILGNHERVRFNAMKGAITGISPRALSDVLTTLQEAGLVTREVDVAEAPPAVSYRLTANGKGLRHALIPLISWCDLAKATGTVRGR